MTQAALLGAARGDSPSRSLSIPAVFCRAAARCWVILHPALQITPFRDRATKQDALVCGRRPARASGGAAHL